MGYEGMYEISVVVLSPKQEHCGKKRHYDLEKVKRYDEILKKIKIVK